MTDDPRRLVAALPPRRVRAVLDALAELRRRVETVDPDRLPLVTLHLASGRDLSGFIVGLDEEGVVVHAPGPHSRQPTWTVVYLDPRAVEAVSVHDAPAVAHTLSGGKVRSAPAPDRPTPSRLVLRREAASRAKLVSEKLGKALPFEVDWDHLGEAQLSGLGDVIVEVGDALLSLAGDPLGRTALAERVDRVRFTDAERPEVLLRERALEIRAALASGGDTRPFPSSVLAAIERAL